MNNFTSEKVDLSFNFKYFCLSLWKIKFFSLRTEKYMASLDKNHVTIHTKSSTFCQFDWYRAFKLRYARIMVTRLKVNTHFMSNRKFFFTSTRTFALVVSSSLSFMWNSFSLNWSQIFFFMRKFHVYVANEFLQSLNFDFN